MGDLSKNFSLSEFLISQTAARMGRELVPTTNQKNYLVHLVSGLMQPVRELVGLPVIITSGLRPEWLNKLIGGSETSQHMKGQACDFVVAGMSPMEVCKAVEASDIQFDQMINEFDKWVHLSCFPRQEMRNEILTARSCDGITEYYNGLD